jgi:hypothetical protein
MSGVAPLHDQFAAWLRDFCSGLGLPVSEGSLAIAFSVKPHTDLFMSDPRDPERMFAGAP